MRSVWASVALVLVGQAIAVGQPSVPNALLSVTVRQKQDGKLGAGLHVLELSCFNERCALTTVTLNQCYPSGEGALAFVPKVQYSSTTDRTLFVRNEGRTLIVRESGTDFGGDFSNTLRFEYSPPVENRAATDLTGFSGGYVKDSTILGKVLTVEYVPLPKLFQVLPLACGALLPGVRDK